MLIREFCAENVERVLPAIRAGAGRIELCDNLARGGTSPSYGVIREAVRIGREHGVAVMAMARPRGGGFVYTADEARMMEDDVSLERELGVDGVVFGCLATGPDGTPALDRPLTERLVAAAKAPLKTAGGSGPAPVQVTFHMAFDELSEKRQREAIDALAELGVDRVLTHGGAAGTPIMGNLERLRRLIEHAAGRVRILPGGGITWENAAEVAGILGVGECHGTRIVRL